MNETDELIARSFARMEATLDHAAQTLSAQLDSGFGEISNRLDSLLKDMRADRLKREREWAAHGLDSLTPPQA